jgi:hypothetical protein
MSDIAAKTAVEQRLQRIEDLLDQLERRGSALGRDPARELFDNLLELHGVALARIIAALARTGDGGDAVARLAHDPTVEAVMLLHSLHPDDAATRIRRALAGLIDEGIDASLVALAGRQATVSLNSPPAGGHLMQRVETALYAAAPELERLTIRPAAHARPEAAQLESA